MWLILALAAYVLFAGATITDKYLLARPIPDARVYAFYTGILGLFAFILVPFGFEIPQGPILFLGIVAGALFISALFLFFLALKSGEASRVGVSVGGLAPFFTLLFIYLGTGQLPTTFHFIAFALLVLGSLVMILDRYRDIFHNARILGLIAASSFLFGLYFTLAKFLFSTQPFISAFIWTRVGGALLALLFLSSRQVRNAIFGHKKSLPKKVEGVFILKNAAGGLAALFQNLAVSMARFSEVALVNALQGVQFALVFLMAVFFAKKFPWIVKEEVRGEALAFKIFGTILVMAGIAILAIT